MTGGENVGDQQPTCSSCSSCALLSTWLVVSILAGMPSSLYHTLADTGINRRKEHRGGRQMNNIYHTANNLTNGRKIQIHSSLWPPRDNSWVFWGKKKFKGKIGMMKEKRMGWKVNYSISAKK